MNKKLINKILAKKIKQRDKLTRKLEKLNQNIEDLEETCYTLDIGISQNKETTNDLNAWLREYIYAKTDIDIKYFEDQKEDTNLNEYYFISYKVKSKINSFTQVNIGISKRLAKEIRRKLFSNSNSTLEEFFQNFFFNAKMLKIVFIGFLDLADIYANRDTKSIYITFENIRYNT